MKKTLSPEARRRRNELIIIGIISILIIIFTTIEMKFPQIGGKIPVANNIIIFTLININIILILLLIFLVIRNLVKLIFERKRKVLGAKIRTKLLAAFVSLSLVPTILLFLVAVGFITNSVEHWFSAQVEQSLQGSLEVAQTYYRDFANNTVSTAQQISKALANQSLNKGPKEMSLVREQRETRRQEHHLSTLGIFLKGEGNTIEVEDPMLKPVSLQLPKDLLEAGFSGKEGSRILSLGGGEMTPSIGPIFNPPEGGGVVVRGGA